MRVRREQALLNFQPSSLNPQLFFTLVTVRRIDWLGALVAMAMDSGVMGGVERRKSAKSTGRFGQRLNLLLYNIRHTQRVLEWDPANQVSLATIGDY
jgi:hypothetical protein